MSKIRKALAGLVAGATLALAPAAIPAAEEPEAVDLGRLDELRKLEEAIAEAKAEPDGKRLSHEQLSQAQRAEQAPSAQAERNELEDRLRDALDAELKFQSDLLAEEDRDQLAPPVALDEASPRAAPGPPELRDLPIAIFDAEEVSIPAGTWGNKSRLKLVMLSLDADGDGKPELVRYVDRKTKLLVREEADRNYDGVTDSWSDFAFGEIVARVLDSNDDGNPDVWESYADGRMSSKEVDRDDDGVRDAFYRYRDGSIADERHDADNDGRIDLVILYENRLRVSAEQDHDTDGRMDTWTTYTVVSGQEVVARIERDTRGDGSITTVEIFDTTTGESVITRRDEDVNGDGEVDIISYYENGKLRRREISNPDLVALIGT